MTVREKAIENINKRIYLLRNALQEAVESGVQSASVSQGGSSQSYTRMSLADIRQSIADLENAKKRILTDCKFQTISPNFTFYK